MVAIVSSRTSFNSVRNDRTWGPEALVHGESLDIVEPQAFLSVVVTYVDSMDLPTLSEFFRLSGAIWQAIQLGLIVTIGLFLYLDLAGLLNYRISRTYVVPVQQQIRANPIASKVFGKDAQFEVHDNPKTALLSGILAIVIGVLVELVLLPAVGALIYFDYYLTGSLMDATPKLYFAAAIAVLVSISAHYHLQKRIHDAQLGW